MMGRTVHAPVEAVERQRELVEAGGKRLRRARYVQARLRSGDRREDERHKTCNGRHRHDFLWGAWRVENENKTARARGERRMVSGAW